MPEFPSIQYEGKTYYEVACRKCHSSGAWDFYFNGMNWIIKCRNCGHVIEVAQQNVTNKPDEKAIDMRFLT